MAAQSVLGQLLDASTGAPVEGALVLLMDEAGEEAGGYLTNQAGRFVIQAPGPGTFTLRAERIGYETITSAPFPLEQAQQFGIRLETAQAAIVLEEIRVEGEQQCVVRPGEGLQLAAVWEEARKALTVQNWTEREGSYRFQVTRYERELDVHGRTVRSETRQVISGVTGAPIRSLPADDLMTGGFVRPSGNGAYDYFGPDASVLLSDQFLDTHCLRLSLDSDRPYEVGLAFEPVRLGRIPDISGTLWLEAETARLRVLEYMYTWAPWEEARGVAKGRVEFENLPSGAWVIRKWWIQMPLVGTDMSMALMQKTAGIRLVGIKEVGGGITRFTSLDRTESSDVPKGVLEGQVWDSTRQAPLAGATVFLSGTQYFAETDAGGNFLFPDLPEGVFRAAFSHPRLDSLGVFSAGVEVEITPGEFTTLVLAIPSSAAVLASTCTPEELEVRTAVVIGYVRERDTEVPVEGATVTVTWSIFEQRGAGSFVERRHGLQATSDATGRYSACGVPLDTTLHILATHLGRETETVQLQAEKDGYTVVHLYLPG
ncbi:MAG: carboxypeptidase regulatory-like domain-containing protein [Gemmatimonadota bacterium]